MVTVTKSVTILTAVYFATRTNVLLAKGCRTAGIGCIECKKILIENVFEVMDPIWKRRGELIENPGILQDIVEIGTEKARKVAEETMQLVREAMGLY